MRLAPVLALALSLAAAAPARAASPYADVVLQHPALAGYWAFNEPAGPVTADLRTTGEALHADGARAGAAPLAGGGHSARYDGRRAATTAANSVRLNPQRAVSLEAWVRPDALPHAATVAGKPGEYALGFTPDGRAVFRVWTGGRTRRLASEPGTIRAGRTTYLVGTYDGREQRLYADGALRASAAHRGRVGKTPRPLVFGGGLRGRLDDVALYDAALTARTIAAHDRDGRRAACAAQPLPVGLAAAWWAPCRRPYLDGSPFDQPLRAGAPQAPGSAAIVARLARRDPPQMIYGLPAATSDPRSERADFQHPVYTADWTDAASRIACLRYACPELRGSAMPVPPGARPAQAGDGHLAVLADGGDVEYDLWQVGGEGHIAPALPGDGARVRASSGGRTEAGEGLDYGLGAGATAAQFGLAAGVIRAAELQASEIDHALLLAVDCTVGMVPPARGEGKRCEDRRDAPAMGQRLRLDYTPAEIRALDAPPWKKAVLGALARYGAYIGDTGASDRVAFHVAVESGETYTSLGAPDFLGRFWADVDGSPDRAFGNYRFFDLGGGVDWRRLRVVDPCVAQRSC